MAGCGHGSLQMLLKFSVFGWWVGGVSCLQFFSRKVASQRGKSGLKA